MDAWNISRERINVDEHSAIVAVGGDGTLHEVINGMMNREDKKKLPIAFIPNGSGNDLVSCFGIDSVLTALDYLRKGDTVKMDLNKVLIDADSEADVPVADRFEKLRYSVINASIGFIAKTVHKAASAKSWAGKHAYVYSGVSEFLGGCRPDTYSVQIEQPDGTSQTNENLESVIIFINNGKFCGGGLLITPTALLNDGLLDIAIRHGGLGTRDCASILTSLIKYEGAHAYRDDFEIMRASTITFTNKNYMRNASVATSPNYMKKQPQMLQVDGEPMMFSEKVKIEVLPEAIDVIVNFDRMM